MNPFVPYGLNGRPFFMAALMAAGIVALVVAASPRTALASVTIAEDDFEEHAQGSTGYGWLDDWTFVADASYQDSGSPNQGNSHLRLRDGDASAVRSVDVTGETALRLQFWARADNFDEDDAVVEVSADGSSYVKLREWEDDDNGPYAFFDFDLSTTGLTFTSQLWVRVRIDADEEHEDDDGEFFIDQLVLLNSADNPTPPPAPGTVPIDIDGDFADWTGKANLADAFDDQLTLERYDIGTFFWTNNINEEVNYHMLERHTTDGLPYDGSNGQDRKTDFIVYIDTNNNGDFSENEDRRAVVSYEPKNNDSQVRVKVYQGFSSTKISDSGWNDWGESRAEGGLKVEFALDWNDLGISFGGVIRMYAVTFSGVSSAPSINDRVPDGTADVQWSPASVLGMWLLGAAAAAGIGIIWYLSRRRRLWT